MGGHVWPDTDWGDVVIRREKVTHQPPGAKGSLFCTSDVCSQQDQCARTTPYRQHHSYCIHKPQRGNTLSKVVRHSHTDMGGVQREEHLHTRGAHSRAGEQRGRQRIKEDSRLQQLELHTKVFQRLYQQWGPMDVDLFAACHKTQLLHFFSFRPDPAAVAVDALSQRWTQI